MISPDRLAALIAGWTHEAEVAEVNQRADEYAGMCRDTVEALEELDRLRVVLAGMTRGYIVTRTDPELPAPYVYEPQESYRVQCRCGWLGKTAQLIRLQSDPGQPRCPSCTAKFSATPAAIVAEHPERGPDRNL